MVKKCTKSEGKGDGRRVEVSTDPLRYSSTGAAHQNVSLKGSEHVTSCPEKQSEYETMGPLDQPLSYEALEANEQPIYEETF